MDATDDESELWRRARQDDGAAFAALFDRHHAGVYRRALGLVGEVHDAEDIAAAAFFELWRKRRSVRLVSGSVRPWLLVTTVNLSRNSRRGTARYRRLLHDIPRPDSAPGPDAEHVEARQKLAASLGRLSPDDASLVVLTALEGIPITQAAQTLGLTAATARVRLHRARARLRVELEDLNPHAAASIEGSAS